MAKFFLHDIEIGRRLVDLRGDKSAREIAIGAGIDPSQYVKIEKGKSSITENILEKLTGTYKWNEDYILWGEGINVPHETFKAEDLKDFIKSFPGLVTLLNKQHDTIHELATKVPKAPNISDTRKNGQPSKQSKTNNRQK